MINAPNTPADGGGDNTQPAPDANSVERPVLRPRLQPHESAAAARRTGFARRDPAGAADEAAAAVALDFGAGARAVDTDIEPPVRPPEAAGAALPAPPAARPPGRPRVIRAVNAEDGTGGLPTGDDDLDLGGPRRPTLGAPIRARRGGPRGRATVRLAFGMRGQPRASPARPPAARAAWGPAWGRPSRENFEEDDEETGAFFTGPAAPTLDLTGPDSAFPADPADLLPFYSDNEAPPRPARDRPAPAGPPRAGPASRGAPRGGRANLSAPRAANPPAGGLFQSLHEPPIAGLAAVPTPSTKELNAISKEALLLVFDHRRLAQITRPRSASDDVKAAAHLKAQATLGNSGWANSSTDTEFHPIYYGCQIAFRPGMGPATFGVLIGWAIPFALDHPQDISRTADWAAIYKEAAILFPLLESEVHNCRSGGREFNLPASLLSKIRELGASYFTLRASALLPVLALLDSSPLGLQARHAIAGFIQQASTFPATWDYIDTMIKNGVLGQHGTDPAQRENAARVAMARPVLTALLQGQTLSWDVTELVQAHVAYVPSLTLLHSTDFGKLVMTSPAAAALAASLPLVAPTTSSWASLPPGPLTDPGTRAPSAVGRTHPLYYSGEYPVPPGWLPPPPAAPLPGPSGALSPGAVVKRADRNKALTIPTSRLIVGSSSPFPVPSTHPCDYCLAPGHAQYECPRRFGDQFNRPLPGFTLRGDYDLSAWAHGDLVPAARIAMASYLRETGVSEHRRFHVTLDHIATGTAPPPPSS